MFGAFRKGKAYHIGACCIVALCIYLQIYLDVYVPQNIGSPNKIQIPNFSTIVILQSSHSN